LRLQAQESQNFKSVSQKLLALVLKAGWKETFAFEQIHTVSKPGKKLTSSVEYCGINKKLFLPKR